jgi:hypothetical protein
LDKLPIYTALGVAEVWRYDGQNLTIFWLEGSATRRAARSLSPADVPAKMFSSRAKRRHIAWASAVEPVRMSSTC